MVEQATAPEPPPPRPIPALTLLATAVRDVGARWPQALGLWAAGAALALGGQGLRTWAHLGRVSLSPEWVGSWVLTAAAAAVLASLTLRLFLVPGRGWWRLDRRAWACAGLLAAAALAASALALLSLGMPKPGQFAGLGLRILLNFGGQILLWWVYARLLLWPIGVLMGEPAMTPARSWRLMAGQVAGFVGAVILINLPLVAVGAFFRMSAILAHRGPALDGVEDIGIVSALVGPALTVLQRAMAAAIYGSRAGTGE